MEKHKIVSKASTEMPSRGEAKGQDWKPVVFEDPRRTTTKEASGALATARPGASTGPPLARTSPQLEEETEELSHLRVSSDLRVALMQARAVKGLSQKELATQLNMPHATIVSLENGKALADNALVARLERHLCCKLPRTRKKAL